MNRLMKQKYVDNNYTWGDTNRNSNDVRFGYNQACEEWEKWLDEKKKHNKRR